MKDVLKIFTVSKEIYNDLKAHPQEGITFLGKYRIRVKEIWKDIKGYEGLYQVSNLGRVKRLPWVKSHMRHWSRIEEEKILKPAKVFVHKNKNDYYLGVALCKKGVQKRMVIHRLVAIAFIPNPENKPEVNHKKGIKTDNRVSELEWVTSLENSQHSYRTGLNKIRFGEESPSSKLTLHQINEIRKLVISGKTQKEVANKFKTARANISSIIRNKTWVQPGVEEIIVRNRRSAKLTPADVKIIRCALSENITQRQIALYFNVSQGAINMINTNKRWAKV